LSPEPLILGLLVSLALNDFSFAKVFILHDIPEGAPFIHHPDAILLLWNIFPFNDDQARITLFTLLERLANANHRNRALLSSFNFDVFSYYLIHTDPDERKITSRLLKRLLEMGSTPHISRRILQNAVNDDESLNLDVLDIIRSAVKGRWTTHLSMESDAALDWNGGKRVPVEGFTLTVRPLQHSFGSLVDLTHVLSDVAPY
jgi:hypothetical protein